MSTKIEWVRNQDGSAGVTWNPITGCTPISPGCQRCYAAAIAKRFWGDRKFSDVRFHADRLVLPHWHKPRMVFVNSMSDLFHPDVSDDDIDRVFARIAAESRHTFQVLTKRPERARDYLLAKQQQMYDEGTFWFFDGRIHPRDGDKLGVFGFPNHWPLRNLWFGWTAENQEYFDKRTPVGLQVPAALHYISLEPLLESVDLSGLVKCERCTPTHYEPMTKWIDWTIIGPETGAGRRPCKLEWIESIVDQCHAAGVPVFVKALPGKKPVRDAETIAGVLHCKVADIRQFPGTVTR